MSYRTKCKMYDEVNMGNPGNVPYCSATGTFEPDCDKCNRPNITNGDRIRSMTDEELRDEWFRIKDEVIPRYNHSYLGLLDWLGREAEA